MKCNVALRQSDTLHVSGTASCTTKGPGPGGCIQWRLRRTIATLLTYREPFCVEDWLPQEGWLTPNPQDLMIQEDLALSVVSLPQLPRSCYRSKSDKGLVGLIDTHILKCVVTHIFKFQQCQTCDLYSLFISLQHKLLRQQDLELFKYPFLCDGYYCKYVYILICNILFQLSIQCNMSLNIFFYTFWLCMSVFLKPFLVIKLMATVYSTRRQSLKLFEMILLIFKCIK